MAKEEVKKAILKYNLNKVLHSILLIAHHATVYIHTCNICYFVLIHKHGLSKQLFAFLRCFAQNCNNSEFNQ